MHQDYRIGLGGKVGIRQSRVVGTVLEAWGQCDWVWGSRGRVSVVLEQGSASRGCNEQKGLPWAGEWRNAEGVVTVGLGLALWAGHSLGLGHLRPAAYDNSCRPLGATGDIFLPPPAAKTVRGRPLATIREGIPRPETQMSFGKQSSWKCERHQDFFKKSLSLWSRATGLNLNHSVI